MMTETAGPRAPKASAPESEARLRAVSRVTVLGAVVNSILVVVKGVVGLIAGSSVLVADAVHSLSDFGSDVVVMLSLRAASKPPDEEHPYGHGRYETLGAVVLAVLLLGVVVLSATGVVPAMYTIF